MGRREDRDGDIRQLVAELADENARDGGEIPDDAFASVTGRNFCPLIWANLTEPQKREIVRFAIYTADAAIRE